MRERGFVPPDNPGPESPFHVRPPTSRMLRAALVIWAVTLSVIVGLFAYCLLNGRWTESLALLGALLLMVPLRMIQIRAASRELWRRHHGTGQDEPPTR